MQLCYQPNRINLPLFEMTLLKKIGSLLQWHKFFTQASSVSFKIFESPLIVSLFQQRTLSMIPLIYICGFLLCGFAAEWRGFLALLQFLWTFQSDYLLSCPLLWREKCLRAFVGKMHQFLWAVLNHWYECLSVGISTTSWSWQLLVLFKLPHLVL